MQNILEMATKDALTNKGHGTENGEESVNSVYLKDISHIDPGFFTRRVKRPNPMDQWSPKTQQEIKNDFDALKDELLSEHNTPQCQKADNEHASRLYKKFKKDEQRGRRLLKYGIDPISFFYGAFILGRARFALFSLGHEVLHGTYRTHEDPLFRGNSWDNPLFINDKHWKQGHNQGHHKTPGVFGLDPEASPVNYRGSDDFYAEQGDRIAAIFNAYILNFHSLFFIGLVEAKKVAQTDDNAWKDIYKTIMALAKEEFVKQPLKGGLNAPRVLAGNSLSFFFAELISGVLGRSTHVRDDTTCLHINEFDPNDKAHFYIVSVLNAGNFNLKNKNEYIGGFDKHIEHHLFPFLSSRMLEKASPRVKALCEKYDLPYHEGDVWKIIKEGYSVDFKNLFAA